MAEGRRFILWIILLVLVIGGFSIYLVTRRSGQKEQPQKTTETTTEKTTPSPEATGEDLTNITPSTVDSQIEENLNLATQKAKEWGKDAALVYAQVKLTSVTPGEGNETYVFDSPSLKDYYFVFTISQESKKYIRATIPTEDYLGGGLLPIDLKYWKLNYVSALQLSEKEDGKDFREKNLDWTIELNLKRGEPKNWLYFIVEYKTKEGESLSVKINPYSGEVVKEAEEGT